jgi:hypothetical protein
MSAFEKSSYRSIVDIMEDGIMSRGDTHKFILKRASPILSWGSSLAYRGEG